MPDTPKRPRSHNGEPKPFKRKNEDRWAVTLQVRGQRYTVYGRTERDCKRELERLKAALKAGKQIGADQQRLGDYLAAWLSRRRGEGLSYSSYATYESAIRTHVVPTLGNVRLADLRSEHFDQLQAALRDHGIQPSTIAKARRILDAALNEAVARGILDRNPSKIVRRPAVTKHEPTMLSLTQMERFLEAAQEDRHGLAWLLLAFTGVRIAELLGLRWTDIDWQQSRIVVARQVARVADGGLGLTETKTHRGRVVAVPLFLLDALRERYHPENTGLLFTSATGGFARRESFERWLAAFCERAGLPPLKPHDLRHWYSVTGQIGGVPTAVVAAQLGHTSAMTVREYSHLGADLQQMAAEVMQRLFGPKI